MFIPLLFIRIHECLLLFWRIPTLHCFSGCETSDAVLLEPQFLEFCVFHLVPKKLLQHSQIPVKIDRDRMLASFSKKVPLSHQTESRTILNIFEDEFVSHEVHEGFPSSRSNNCACWRIRQDGKGLRHYRWFLRLGFTLKASLRTVHFRSDQ